ncbi:sensor histidine kinase [Brevundimonas sp.]|uniref:sensor histidine kinase n=1 Tax=Brevundimonas sp. TaxID=1871086 RepID=UPI003BAD964C
MSSPAHDVQARPWSLKRRLAMRLSVLAVVAILGPLLFILFNARLQIDNLTEMAIQQQAVVVGEALITPQGTVKPMPLDLASAYRRAGDDFMFIVRDGSGRIVAQSSSRAEALLGGMRHPSDTRFLVAPIDGGSWLAYARDVGAYQVVVAQDQLKDDVLADSIAYDFAEASLLLTLPLLLTVLGVVYLTLTVLFRRVDRVSAAAAALAPGERANPLPVDGLPSEVVSLVHAVNLALARLSQAYDTEKRFTADAAHELRTPLAILTARVEGLKSTKDRATLQGDVNRINRVVDQLLQAARLDARPIGAAPVDLGRLLLDAVAEVAPLAVRQGREIALDVASGKPIMVYGDASALTVVVANLIDNALRHTRSGPIDILARPSGGFDVMDRGEGVAEADRRLLFERFQRGHRPVGSGSGLGLAIVRQIVEQLGGSVGVADRPGGGSVFSVNLRLANPPAATLPAPVDY